MTDFTLTENEKAKGLSLPQRVVTWWYTLSSKQMCALEIKYRIVINSDNKVWDVYQKEHK